MKDKEEDICYLLTSLMGGSSLACKIIKLDSSGFDQLMHNLMEFVHVREVCLSCPPLEIEAVDEVTEATLDNQPSEVTTEPTTTSAPFVERPPNGFLLHLINAQSSKCLKYHDGKVMSSDCTCYFCSDEEKEGRSLKWYWSLDYRIVSYTEGKVLEVTEDNEPIILANYNATNPKQEWYLQRLYDDMNPHADYFAIINRHEYLKLCNHEDSYTLTFVPIGAKSQPSYDSWKWYLKILE